MSLFDFTSRSVTGAMIALTRTGESKLISGDTTLSELVTLKGDGAKFYRVAVPEPLLMLRPLPFEARDTESITKLETRFSCNIVVPRTVTFAVDAPGAEDLDAAIQRLALDRAVKIVVMLASTAHAVMRRQRELIEALALAVRVVIEAVNEVRQLIEALVDVMRVAAIAAATTLIEIDRGPRVFCPDPEPETFIIDL